MINKCSSCMYFCVSHPEAHLAIYRPELCTAFAFILHGEKYI